MGRKLITYLGLFLLLTSQSFAASPVLKLESQKTEVGIGEEFQVDLFLEADFEEPVYYLEADLSSSGNRLEIFDLSIEDSVIGLWSDVPKLSKNIYFSGNIPRGFPLTEDGAGRGLVYSIKGRAATAGQKIFILSNVKVQIGPKAENTISYPDQEFIMTVLPVFEERLFEKEEEEYSEEFLLDVETDQPSENSVLKYSLIFLGIVGLFLMLISLKSKEKKKEVE